MGRKIGSEKEAGRDKGIESQSERELERVRESGRERERVRERETERERMEGGERGEGSCFEAHSQVIMMTVKRSRGHIFPFFPISAFRTAGFNFLVCEIWFSRCRTVYFGWVGS